jgi:DNA-3-methyladenine glycosylase II
LKTKSAKEAHNFLMEQGRENCLEFARLVEENGELDLVVKSSFKAFEFLSETAVSQQLSKAAATTIWTKVTNFAECKNIGLSDLFQEHYSENLKACGISSNKIKALIKLNDRFLQEPELSSWIAKADYKMVTEIVTSFWGFGSWSADMCAMFFCGLPDVFPEGDMAIRNGCSKLFGEDSDFRNEALRYSPFRTLFCRHIWFSIDHGNL